ncbi:glycosyltransferase family 87 protein [Halobaculum rubrum]|uniref:glycosyltransferase family 87 protein n=1 Tax=Halobaculum rubrum TaxID=2872158 RepID=UPI001CA3A3A6|nr:glycosyltransferase family 87 protein [Halobaculum rubrum]QZX99901.1 DUF2029 domain-containing protein [Halobaculum rubrum]
MSFDLNRSRRSVSGPRAIRPLWLDFRTYETAVEVFFAGGNPYDLQTLRAYGHGYPFVYPPVTLPFLALLTVLPRFFHPLYMVQYAVFAGICMYVLATLVDSRDPIREWIWTTTAVTCGFAGTYWTLLSGNSDVIVLLLLCLGLVAVASERWYVSGILFGIAGSIKIIPLVATGTFLVTDASLRDRVSGVFGAVTGAVLVFGSSALFFDALFPAEFLASVRSEGGVTAIAGEGVVTNFPLLYLWQDIARLAGVSHAYGIAFHGIFSLAVISLGIWWVRRTTRPEAALALSLLGTLLVFTRMKPYYTVYEVPAVVPITAVQRRDNSELVRWPDVILVAVIPFIAKVFYTMLSRETIRSFHPIATMALQYAPILVLLGWAVYRFPAGELSVADRVRGFRDAAKRRVK